MSVVDVVVIALSVPVLFFAAVGFYVVKDLLHDCYERAVKAPNSDG